MTIWRLVTREILYRKLSFVLGALAVAVAVTCVVASVGALKAHDRRAEQILSTLEAESKQELNKLEDEIRKITKNLGFNIRILPKDVNLVDFYAKDYADKYMPEEYAERLAKAPIVTINHVLPALQQKIDWPEQEMSVLLIGTRGELPMASQETKKPLLDAVPRGKIVLGYQLHRTIKRARNEDLKKGDAIVLLGRKFAVHRLNPKRGDQDDVTVWINLEEAQELLQKPKQINSILALNCNCEDLDRLGSIRKEIEDILPDTQVEEFETKATARAEARNKVAAEAKATLAREKKNQDDIRQEIEALTSSLVPLVAVLCGIWLGILAWNNVRERRTEIGLLRALGLGSGRLLVLFLSRAIIIGFGGAAFGFLASLAILATGDASGFDPVVLTAVFVGAPLVAALASWLPAFAATQQDPAVILQEE